MKVVLKAGIGIAIIVGMIVVFFLFTNIEDIFSKKIEEFASEVKVTNPIQPYKINTECELINFLNNGEKMYELITFIEDNEELFMQKYFALGGPQTDPLDRESIIKKDEVSRVVFAEIIIEEFSANPNLKSFIIDMQGKSSQNLIKKIQEIDPNCVLEEGILFVGDPSSIENYNELESFGVLGDDHTHASILVRIFGDKFDFSSPAYQIKSSWIHFEGQDGNTIHRHATGVRLGFLFETIGITLNDECYVFPDHREFCTNENNSLKFFINQQQVSGITDHVIQEGDRILISYGNESPTEINEQLEELEKQLIFR